MADGVSVRDSLTSAMESLSADPAAEAVAPAATPVETTAPEPKEPVAETPVADAGSQDRDEHGRFKPKTSEAQAGAEPAAAQAPKEPETAKPEDTGSQAETTRIPPSLSAAVKAQWTELPPVVRDEFSRLEESFQKGKAEWAPKGQRLNRYDEIIGPYLDKWRFAGLDEFTGVQTLIAAQNILERNPVEGLVHIARSYGVHPSQIAQGLASPQTGAQPGAEGQTAPTAAPNLDAALQPFVQRVQTLEQQLEQSAQAAKNAEIARLTAEVEAFANDPANKYFHNVEDDMVRLIQAKAASGIKDAYQKAIWASDEIRPLLLKEQAAGQTTNNADAVAQAKAKAARQASGSVTGAPSPGATAPKPGSTGSIRADLEAAMQQHSATA